MNRFELLLTTRGDVKYFDILIDGKPLAENFAGRLGAIPDSISPLRPSGIWLEPVRLEQFERFLLEKEPDLPDGRNSILVCPLCGDLECGAYSAKFQREGEIIRWSEFGNNFGYEEENEEYNELNRYRHIPDFVFSWKQYEEEIRRYIGV